MLRAGLEATSFLWGGKRVRVSLAIQKITHHRCAKVSPPPLTRADLERDAVLLLVFEVVDPQLLHSFQPTRAHEGGTRSELEGGEESDRDEQQEIEEFWHD